MATDGTIDRARGVLLGLAVGDALGGPLEFLSAAEIRARYGGPVGRVRRRRLAFARAGAGHR